MNRIFRQDKEPPEFFRMAKPNIQIPQYMEDCMNGAPHPMNIEFDDYVRTTIGKVHLDLEFQAHQHYGTQRSEQTNLTEEEEHAIQTFKDRPEAAWAMYNSFDGLYIKKDINHAEGRVFFTFAVYMKSSNKTFWMLKYAGDNRL